MAQIPFYSLLPVLVLVLLVHLLSSAGVSDGRATPQLANHLSVEAQIFRIHSIVDVDEFCYAIERKESQCDASKAGSGSFKQRLAGHFLFGSTSQQRHDANACHAVIERQLSDLKSLVDDDGDYCSHERITAVERFHNEYLEPEGAHHALHKSNRYFPSSLVLNNYFVLYASELSTICEQVANDKLGPFIETVDSCLVEDDKKSPRKVKTSDVLKMSKQLGTLDNFVASLGKTFSISMNPSYESMFMPWNLVKILQRHNEFQFDQMYNFDNSRLTLQIKNAQDIKRLQNFCRNYARPTYDGSLLPVMRLVHLGYYPRSDQLIKRIRKSVWATRQYMFAHLCELVLPINAIENASLDTYQVVVVKRDDLSSPNAQQDFPQQDAYGSDPSPDNSGSWQLDDSSTFVYDESPFMEQEDVAAVRKIKKDIRERRKRMESLLWILMARLKRHFDLGDFFDTLANKKDKKKSFKGKKPHKSGGLKLGKMSEGLMWKVVYYVGMKFIVNLTIKAVITSVVVYNKVFVEGYVKMHKVLPKALFRKDTTAKHD